MTDPTRVDLALLLCAEGSGTTPDDKTATCSAAWNALLSLFSGIFALKLIAVASMLDEKDGRSGPRVYSLAGKSLKLDSAEDAAPYVAELAQLEHVEELHLCGNTIGVGAAQAFASVLSTKTTLKVCTWCSPRKTRKKTLCTWTADKNWLTAAIGVDSLPSIRWLTWPTSSPAD